MGGSKKKQGVAKTPLAVCPACDKVLASMRSMFGHYGVKHRNAIDQDAIKYGCPFCSDKDDDEHVLFDTMEELESHMEESHPNDSLLDTMTYVGSGGTLSTATSKKKKAATLPHSTPSPESSSKSKPKKSTPQKKPPPKLGSDGKPIKQNYSHPFCKCPQCPKIFVPSGLFGHFGRVHSGQLGHTVPFEWSDVSFVCPYCPGDKEDLPLFPTIDLAEAHVSKHHPNCHLIQPNAMSSSTSSKSKPLVKARTKPAVKTSSLSEGKKRSSNRRTSADDNDEEEEDEELPLGMRKPQRTRRPVDNSLLITSAEMTTVRGAAIKPPPISSSIQDEDVKALYNCPDCDKTNLSKHGLYAHYGMKHGGKLDITRCTLVKGSSIPSKKKKKKTSNVPGRTGPWTDEEHKAFMEGCRVHGNKWKQISIDFVPTRDAKQVGSHALNYFTQKGEWDKIGGKHGYQGPGRLASLAMDEDKDGEDAMSVESDETDDGNSSHCIVCFEGGNIVCCSNCPRAYHPKCLAKDGSAYGGGMVTTNGAVDIDLMPDDWQCNRCKRDIVVSQAEEIPNYAFGNKKIRSAYIEFKDSSDYNSCCTLLSNILDILAKLQSYDYGFVFSEPVSTDDVPDYLDVVQIPMDYSTIVERLESGKYVDLIEVGESSTMEGILLHCLQDIKRVHHNCQLYNKVTSSIYRIANIHDAKWKAYFNQYILEKLPEKVQLELQLFYNKCQLELREGGHSQRALDKAKALASPNNQSRKRKASEELDDYYYDEDEDDVDDGDDDDDEDEHTQMQPMLAKPKESHAAVQSSALFLTEDQVRSLEHVFFSSTAKLSQESSTSLPQDVSTDASPKSPSKDDMTSQPDAPKTDTPLKGTTGSLGNDGVTYHQKQWYERLDELKKHKIAHGTAVVPATSNDKLYHWRSRTRKRYHLTLHHMPHLKKVDGSMDEHQGDKQWLLTMPEMRGVFSISSGEGEGEDLKPLTMNEKDVKDDEETVHVIRLKHKVKLYCPPSQAGPQPGEEYSSRLSNSLFWDECLEELRFFQDEHGHTLVSRDFPFNSYLSLWVEIQRAKYLLHKIGLATDLTGAQMLVLDELNICDLSLVPTVDKTLKSDTRATGPPLHITTTPQKSNSGKNSKSKNSWTSRVGEFKEWFASLSPEDKSKASTLLPRLNKPLYSWCWRQCNASSAVLCETPNIPGMSTISVKRMKSLSLAGFYQAFPYNDRKIGLVCEDDYEGSDAFDSTFQILEDFSIKYCSTLIPSWYDCDEAFRMWVSALENGVTSFVRGEPCVLSAQQIERLVLIGFCNDREGLPNLTRGDIVWLKMFSELSRHHGLFGIAPVSSDFPRLHQWIAEQKELFLLSRIGSKEIMKPSRFKMLVDSGLDFFTGECLPGTASMSKHDLKQFQSLTSAPAESFPTSSRRSVGPLNFQKDNGWNNQVCQEKFEQLLVKNGHSLILASDDIDIYRWFVEKRGGALLSEMNTLKFNKRCYETNGIYSNSILRYVTFETGGLSIEELDQSMFIWLHYYERLMMFKAREGHCKLPKEYPDFPLQHWLMQQQDMIHSYSKNQSIGLRPAQMKLLLALGVHGSKLESVHPKLSTRIMKRKHPEKKKRKPYCDLDLIGYCMM